jgi:ribosome-associated protein
MLIISENVALEDKEIEITGIRSQGPGGQNVNKVSSAVHLRFDIRASSLPDGYKRRLLAMRNKRITKEGVIVIKAQQYRTLEKNRIDALERLRDMIRGAIVVRKVRRPTRPSRRSKMRRMDRKTHRGRLKALRARVTDRDGQ